MPTPLNAKKISGADAAALAAAVEPMRQAVRMVRAMHRIQGEPLMRKRTMLQGLCQLAGAERAMSVVTEIHPETGRASAVSAVSYTSKEATEEAGATRSTRSTVGGAAARGRGRRAEAPSHVAGAAEGPCMDLFLSLSGVRLVACLTICRRADGPRFSPLDRSIVEAVHDECRWVYEHDELVAGETLAALDPRERLVLQGLVSGLGEKQIAVQWSLNVHMVHQHIKAIYRRFGVRSRGQLMARWTGHQQAGSGLGDSA